MDCTKSKAMARDMMTVAKGFLKTRSLSLCDHMSNGVFVILGGVAAGSMDIIHSFSKTFHMPYVTHNTKHKSAGDIDGYVLKMRPSHSEAIRDLIQRYKWKNIHYIYNSDDGLMRFQEIYRELSKLQLGIKIRIRRLQNVSRAHDDLRLLDRLKPSDSNQYIVFDFERDKDYHDVLRQVREVGMNRQGYNYLLGTLDIRNLGIERYRHGGVNITGFQLIDYDKTQVKDFLRTWRTLKPWLWPGAGTSKIELDAALAVDALRAIRVSVEKILANDSNAFKYTFRRREVYNYNKTRGVPCVRPVVPWMHGDALINGMKKIKFRGISGKVAFNRKGFRKDYKFDVYKVSLDRDVRKIGEWKPSTGFVGEDDDKVEPEAANHTDELQIVNSILEEPFLMDKCASLRNGQPCIEHNRFEGYCVDLMNEVAQIVGLKYRIKLVEDGIYGVDIGNNTWNGIIGELINGKAHIAVAPLTITSEREHVVDFSKPFMDLGISIMIKKPEKQKPGVFSFLQSFSFSVWMCFVAGYFLVSLGIFFVSRCSPTEWEEMREDGTVEIFYNNFTFGRSMWFAMGSLMLQGSDHCPRSAAGRMIGGAWWFSVLFMLTSYMANLAAFLTIEKLVTDINSAEDLAKQTKMSYGCVRDGATREFFRNSNISTYQTMSAFMDANPDANVESVWDGVERVRGAKGRYAFLMESVYNDYISNRRPCDTMKVGPNLNNKGYGIATPRYSPWRNLISLAVLELAEDGVLLKLKKTWWVDKGQCGQNSGYRQSKKLSLSLSNIAGAYFILIGGLVISVIVGVLEFICYRAKDISGTAYMLGKEVRVSNENNHRVITSNPENGMVSPVCTRHANGSARHRNAQLNTFSFETTSPKFEH
ncbi:hypothetical protein ScPMuIL_011198 [Solemya velum]